MDAEEWLVEGTAEAVLASLTDAHWSALAVIPYGRVEKVTSLDPTHGTLQSVREDLGVHVGLSSQLLTERVFQEVLSCLLRSAPQGGMEGLSPPKRETLGSLRIDAWGVWGPRNQIRYLTDLREYNKASELCWRPLGREALLAGIEWVLRSHPGWAPLIRAASTERRNLEFPGCAPRAQGYTIRGAADWPSANGPGAHLQALGVQPSAWFIPKGGKGAVNGKGGWVLGSLGKGEHAPEAGRCRSATGGWNSDSVLSKTRRCRSS